MVQFGIRNKILVGFTALLVTPMLLLAVQSFATLGNLGERNLEAMDEVGETAIDNSTESISDLAKQKMVEMAKSRGNQTDDLGNAFLTDTRLLAALVDMTDAANHSV